jgi:NAD-dependent dihydropyrimidine dehydrogenase PreA subunit
MLYVNEKRCSGCRLCADVCRVGAITLHNGVATIDHDLCRECEACANVCPEGAILTIREPALIPQRAHEIGASERQRAPVPLTARIAPTVGAAPFFTGRETVPGVTNYVSEAFDRKMSSPFTTDDSGQPGMSSTGKGRGGGRRSRRRRRGRR